MTKTTELAEKYADDNYNEYSTDGFWCTESDHEPIKDAYKNGAQDMLERVCMYLESEHPTWYEHFEEELKKAMEE